MPFRITAAELSVAQAARLIAGEFAARLDEGLRADLFGEDPKEPRKLSVVDIITSFSDALLRAKERHARLPGVDLAFELGLLPSDAGTLAVPYTDNREALELWNGWPGVEPYGYGDSTDRPDSIAEEDWDTRARHWTCALAPDPMSRPGYAGLTALVIDEGLPWASLTAIEAALPTPKTRARKLARALLGDARFETARQNGAGLGEAALGVTDWFASKEGQAAFETETRRILDRLPEMPDINKSA